MIFEICAIISVVLFAILSVFIIQFLIAARKTINTLDQTAKNLELHISSLESDISLLLTNTNSVTESINSKLIDLDPLFNSVSKVGNALDEAADSLDVRKQKIKSFSDRTTLDSVQDILEVATIALKMLSQIKRRRE